MSGLLGDPLGDILPVTCSKACILRSRTTWKSWRAAILTSGEICAVMAGTLCGPSHSLKAGRISEYRISRSSRSMSTFGGEPWALLDRLDRGLYERTNNINSWSLLPEQASYTTKRTLSESSSSSSNTKQTLTPSHHLFVLFVSSCAPSYSLQWHPEP